MPYGSSKLKPPEVGLFLPIVLAILLKTLGGTNPAIRTLFYRLARLLSTPIEPVFVFDGPDKPLIKRNKRSGRGDGVATSSAKRLIRLFGFSYYDAPGEAEAECALLQQRGIVDTVLSEDVDTIMFGCTRTLRNWTPEGKGTSPTHVSLYDVREMGCSSAGLDREGLVLVALLNGGDYDTEGVPGCGVKVACEAAKAGYGKSLCRLKASDGQGIQSWRAGLVRELQTNDSGFFRTKHKALAVPEEFPNMTVLRYYTHPVVSSDARLESLQERLVPRQLDVVGLREFTRETFGWDYRVGAIKFVRVLAQALLTKKLLEEREPDVLVKKISGLRSHFSTDATPELRLNFVPAEVVPIDMSQEVEEDVAGVRSGLALNSDEEYEANQLAPSSDQQPAPITKMFDITKPSVACVLEVVVRKSVPALVYEWEEAQREAALRKSSKHTEAAKKAKAQMLAMPQATLDAFVKVTKTSSATKPDLKDGNVLRSDTSEQRNARKALSTRALKRPPSLPRLASKQSDPSKPMHDFASSREIVSSQREPRTTNRYTSTLEEPILITSSPPAASRSPGPSSSPSRTSDACEVPRLPDRQSTTHLSTEAVGMTSRAKKRVPTKKPQATASTSYKQTSIDTFVTSSQPRSSQWTICLDDTPNLQDQGENAPPATSRSDPSQSDLELEPLAPLLIQPEVANPNIMSASVEMRDVSCAKDDNPIPRDPFSPDRVTRKKLYVSRKSAVGYFKEIEVDVEERELMIHEANKAARPSVRMSDASIIDLTEM